VEEEASGRSAASTKKSAPTATESPTPSKSTESESMSGSMTDLDEENARAAADLVTSQFVAASPNLARLINAMYSRDPEESRKLFPEGTESTSNALKLSPEQIRHIEELEAQQRAAEHSASQTDQHTHPLQASGRFTEVREGARGRLASTYAPGGAKPPRKAGKFSTSDDYPDGKFEGTSLEDSPQEIVHATAVQIFDSLSLALPDNVRHAVNRTVTRECSRDIITQLTTSLTMSISSLLVVRLPREIIHRVTHQVTRPLIPMLTHSLATSVTHAITRKTEDDYFCYFCLQSEGQIFCPNCRGAMHTEMSIDHYVNYYASYYSLYYGVFYSELYADKITDDYIGPHPWSPSIGPD
jgi:hypothetical protein